MPAPKVTASRATQNQAYHQVPRKGKDTDPRHFSKTPFAYGDVLLAGDKLGSALHRDLIYWIERRTWGTNISKNPDVIIRPEFAKLSLAELCRLCCVKERKTVLLALAYLEKHKIIQARERTGCSKTVAKMYKLTPEHWEAAPPYKPPTAAEIEAIVDDEPESDDEPLPEPITGTPQRVQPGKSSRPQPVAIRQGKDAPAVTIRVVYHNDQCPFPLSFRAKAGTNGRLQITASRAEKGESKANGCSHGRPQLTGESKANTEANKRFELFTEYVNQLTLKVWGKATGPARIGEILTAAGDAPLEFFQRLADKKLRGRDAEQKHSPGLLIFLAREASEAWRMENALQARRTSRHESRPVHPEEATRDASTEAEAAAQQREQLRTRCEGCAGTGKRDSGITGMQRNCGICKGTGRNPKPAPEAITW